MYCLLDMINNVSRESETCNARKYIICIYIIKKKKLKLKKNAFHKLNITLYK